MTDSLVEIIHVVPNLFPYGAYGMLSELYFAINKYWSKEFKQTIVNNGSQSKSGHFVLPFMTKTHDDLGTYLKTAGPKIVFLHKLWATDCTQLSKITQNVCPFVIINHTACTNCFGLSRCDAIVTVSESMNKIFKSSFRGQNIQFIRNGVNRCRYDEINPFQPEQVKNFFVTGRLNNFNNTKHPNGWAEFCLNKVNLNKPMWHDYLGDGKYRETAIKEARKRLKNKSGNVMHFPGRIDDFAVKVGHIKRWNVFLYEIPGVEGTSMSMLEAMACGVPAIINNKPGNNEIVKDGTNGFVCKTRKDMISKMKYLTENNKNMEKLRKSTIDFFDQHLDARIMAQKYLDLATLIIKRFKH